VESLRVLCIGDAMIGASKFANACSESLAPVEVESCSWLGDDKAQLQHERILVERGGPNAVPIPQAVLDRKGPYSTILAHYAPVSAGMMDLFPGLRLIGIARAGIENVDLKAATERSIAVFNVTGRNAHAVSDFAVGLIIAELRNIARSHACLLRNEWKKNFANPPHQLQGKRVGIIGMGKVGMLVARKLSGFEVKLAYYDPYANESQCASVGAQSLALVELMATSDIITVHARLSDSTRGLIGRREIAAMKPEAILVNTARAGLIDNSALTEALQSRRIAGAALDVFDEEPLTAKHPLLQLENVTLTSHLAGTTVEALDRTPYLLCENIGTFLKNRTHENLLNPEVIPSLGNKLWRDPL
jgi:D-3-phosphoglycerate dehydrogenase / 2-oxoglutarate reductase